VLFALADTGMGAAALCPTLQTGESCATIEIKMTFLRSVREGKVVCETSLIHRGKTLAHRESKLYVGGVLVASTDGGVMVFPVKANVAQAPSSRQQSRPVLARVRLAGPPRRAPLALHARAIA
jgi:acyl-CoA thioesterase